MPDPGNWKGEVNCLDWGQKKCIKGYSCPEHAGIYKVSVQYKTSATESRTARGLATSRQGVKLATHKKWPSLHVGIDGSLPAKGACPGGRLNLCLSARP